MALGFSDGSVIPYAVGFLVVEYLLFFLYIGRDKLNLSFLHLPSVGGGGFSTTSSDMKNLNDSIVLIEDLKKMVSSLKIEGANLEKIEADIKSLENDRDAALEMIKKKDPSARIKVNGIVDSIIEVQQEIEKMASSG